VTAAPRVLVTGASGFIGRHAIPILLARGYQVHAIARQPLIEHGKGVVQHCTDLLGAGEARGVIKAIRPTHLLHLAWSAMPGRFWTAPDNIDWVAASLRLANAFAEAGGRRAVYAGTCAEYDWNHDWLEESATPLVPATLYGKAKNTLRRLVETAAAQTHVATAWARIFSVYGPYEAPERLVPQVITALLRAQPALCTAGTQERDFLHVEDVARALVTVLESDWQGPVNIASGVCLPLRDIVSMIAELVGRPELVRLGARPIPLDEPSRLAAATDVLRRHIGFQPRYGLSNGLAGTLNWWRSRFGNSQNELRHEISR
jgi:nucleoside-diphosphate-sugar epimerase